MFRNTVKFISIPALFITPSFVYYHNDTKNINMNQDIKDMKYNQEEISKHNTKQDIWITHNNKVYDVTKFVNHHPGGSDYLMMAAGTSITPYWNKYRQHYNPDVEKILDKYHIGYIDESNN